MKDEEKLALLQRYIHLFNKESNIAIYLLLGIYGQMTPNEMIIRTKFGKATIFRSLKELSEAELIGTDIDLSIKDKRKNKVYFVTKELDDFPKIDSQFIDFCFNKSHMDTLRDFTVFQRSIAVNSMKISMDIKEYAQIEDSKEYWYSKLSGRGLFAFTILDLEDNKKIKDYATEFLEKVQSLPDRKQTNPREPMKNPIVLTIGVLPIKNSP